MDKIVVNNREYTTAELQEYIDNLNRRIAELEIELAECRKN